MENGNRPCACRCAQLYNLGWLVVVKLTLRDRTLGLNRLASLGGPAEPGRTCPFALKGVNGEDVRVKSERKAHNGEFVWL